MLHQLPDLLSATLITAEGGGHGTGQIVVMIVTHIIGFLIVFWILKKFAWRPLLNVMDQRRDKIASELKRIEDLNREAEERREEYEKRIETIETEARERINAAVSEGRKVASEIQTNARRDAETIREKAHATVEIEVANPIQWSLSIGTPSIWVRNAPTRFPLPARVTEPSFNPQSRGSITGSSHVPLSRW